MFQQTPLSDINFRHALYQSHTLLSMQLAEPNEHWQLLDTHQNVIACCSLWFTHTPKYQGDSCGLIGHFGCESKQAGAELLQFAQGRIRDHGKCWSVGPIDGSSWFAYRLAVPAPKQPAFSREPWQPDVQTEAFTSAGFNVMERYFSSVQTEPEKRDTRIPAARERLLKNGVTIRALDKDALRIDLAHIYQLSLQAFTNNLFYKSISFETFCSLYEGALAKIPADGCRLAFYQDEPVGFLFSYPDTDAFIVKTVATKPIRACAGLSPVLVDDAVELGTKLGYKKMIFALMHDGGSSKNTAGYLGKPFQYYHLMGARL